MFRLSTAVATTAVDDACMFGPNAQHSNAKAFAATGPIGSAAVEDAHRAAPASPQLGATIRLPVALLHLLKGQFDDLAAGLQFRVSL